MPLPTATVPAQIVHTNGHPAVVLTPIRRRHPGVWLLPICAWLLPNWLYEHAASVHGYDWYSALTRARWDSEHYLTIAQHGYQLERCPAGWCGNTAWFPGYPALVRVAHATAAGRLSWQGSGVAVAEAAGLAALALLWLLLDAKVTPRNVTVLALAAVWPGTVYGHGVFPTSTATAATLAAWWALGRRHWTLAGLAGALAATCYPTAVLYAPAALLWLWLRPQPGRARAAVTVGGLTGAGTFTVAAGMWRQTGHADAYLIAQRSLHVGGIHNPAGSYLDIASGQGFSRAPGTGWYLWPAEKIAHTLAWELHATLALLLVAAVAVGWATFLRRVTPLDVALLTYAGLMYVVPLVLGPHVTQARSHALMLPVVVVMRHLPWWMVAGLVVGAAGMAYRLGVLYVLASIV